MHRERPFFGSLTEFMSSGPAIVLVLEAPDAIKKWRTLMGATDPAKADAGTLRKEFGAVDRAQRDARLGRAGDGGVSSSATSSAAWSWSELSAAISATVHGDGQDCSSSIGLVVAGLGLLMMLGVPLGRLPGDIVGPARQLLVLFSARHVDRVSVC